MSAKPVFSLTAVAALVALSGCAGGGIGFTGNDMSFVRVGTQSCPNVIPSDQGRLVGTARDPLRCGPQQQLIPR